MLEPMEDRVADDGDVGGRRNTKKKHGRPVFSKGFQVCVLARQPPKKNTSVPFSLRGSRCAYWLASPLMKG
jgi:hypothetical protein